MCSVLNCSSICGSNPNCSPGAIVIVFKVSRDDAASTGLEENSVHGEAVSNLGSRRALPVGNQVAACKVQVAVFIRAI